MGSRAAAADDMTSNQEPWQVIDSNIGFDASYDLIIKTQTRHFQAHQARVSKNSLPLTAKMTGPWQEAQVGVLHAEHFDAGTIERFLDYQYLQRCKALPAPTDPGHGFDCS